MVREITTFLSQDGIVLEDLNLGLKEELFNFKTKQTITILGMKAVFFLLKD